MHVLTRAFCCFIRVLCPRALSARVLVVAPGLVCDRPGMIGKSSIHSQWSHQRGITSGLLQVVHMVLWQVFLSQTFWQQAQHYYTMADRAQTYDARIYTVCAPWRGERGDKYVRVFKPSFLNGMDAQVDSYDSLRSHLEGTDTGGNAAGALNHVGNAAAIRASENAYRNRARKAKALLVQHIENPTIKQAIETAVAALPAAVAAGGALPYGAPVGTSIGQLAMIVADSFGNLPVSGLTAIDRDIKWNDISMRQVGYTPESMIDLKAAIDQTNAERPGGLPPGGSQKTPEECRLKFLSLIDAPQALADKAVNECQASTYLVGGNPDYDSTVAGFDELWRTYYRRGDVKHRDPVTIQQGKPGGNRVDAHELATDGMVNELLEFDTDGTIWQAGEEVGAYALNAEGQRVLIC